MLEMKAIVLALAAFLPQLSGWSVILMSDNASVVSYLLNQGSTVSPVLCHMAAEVIFWTECHSVSLTARYIPGRRNVLADFLSCPDQVLPTEWSLLLREFAGSSVVPISTSLPAYQCPASALHFAGSGPNGMEAGRIPTPLGPFVSLCLPTICSVQAGLVESASFDRDLVGSGGTIVATE